MKPGTEAHARYMIPQILWNAHYDRILEREQKNGGKENLVVEEAKTSIQEEL